MIKESLRILREMGVDNIGGYFDIDEVHEAGLATESFESKLPNELSTHIESGEVYLVDVRREAEWNEGRIPQAEYLFLGDLLEKADTLKTDKPIVFQCRTGGRSAVACSIAQAKGIKNVINLDGGIVLWEQEGRPVISATAQTIN